MKRNKLREMIYSELFEVLKENPLANPDGTLPSPRKKKDDDDETLLLGKVKKEEAGDDMADMATDFLGGLEDLVDKIQTWKDDTGRTEKGEKEAEDKWEKDVDKMASDEKTVKDTEKKFSRKALAKDRKNKVMDLAKKHSIKNPKTGRDIKLSSALSKKDHPAYDAAKEKVQSLLDKEREDKQAFVDEGKINEAKFTKVHAAKAMKLVKGTSVDKIIPKGDILYVNYTSYKDRAKIANALSKLYKYDNDGRSTNAPRGIIGLGGANWMSFVAENKVTESDENYRKALVKIARDRQLHMLSKKDKETLLKIAKLMQKEKARK